MRFLFAWQHLEPATRLTGLDGLREVLGGLDGFELAAGAWERTVLPARIDGYEPSMLDMLCLSGEIAWMRLSTANVDSRPPLLVPATPIALFLREHRAAWTTNTAPASRCRPLRRPPGACSSFCASAAPRSCPTLRRPRARHGFAAPGDRGPRRLRTRSLGWFLRLAQPVDDRTSKDRARARPIHRPMDRHTGGSSEDRDEAAHTQAWALLRRYGVVFRRLMTREANAAPWRELTRVFRRLEARGEIRGGRFVSGVSGEQFALPDAVERLREIRRTPADGHLVTVGTADPVNLAGIIAPGERLRAATRNKLVYRDGAPIAVLEGEFVRHLVPLDPTALQQVSRVLAKRRTAHIV